MAEVSSTVICHIGSPIVSPMSGTGVVLPYSFATMDGLNHGTGNATVTKQSGGQDFKNALKQAIAADINGQSLGYTVQLRNIELV